MKKILKWTGIVLAGLLLILILLPYLFKDKIIEAVKKEANRNLNADFNFTSLDLSLIKSFPNLSVAINGLSIVNHEPFIGDTLIYTRSLSVVIDLMSIISGDQMEIKKVLIDGGNFNFLVNNDGKSNWDITKPSVEAPSEGTTSSFKASLKKYSISDSRLVYDDRTLDFSLLINNLNHEGKGDFTQDLFVLSTHSEAEKLTLNYQGVPYLSKVKTIADADLDMNIKEMMFTFRDNRFLINSLPVLFSGWISMPLEDIDMDLKFAADQSDFKSLLSLIPAMYSENFDDLVASGKISFSGFVKGRYNDNKMPGYGLSVSVNNGAFKYPALPSEVKNVEMDLAVTNPDGITDHTFINLQKLHLEMAGDPFDARLIVKTPISDPDLDAFAKGRINLSNISRFVPLEKGTAIAGVIKSDINLKGRLSSIQQMKYDKFDANGQIEVSKLEYTSPAQPDRIQVSSMRMQFSPKQVLLSDLSAQIGQSDFSATGSLENFIAYALKNETLKGTLSLRSKRINLNEFMSEDQGKATVSDTTVAGVILVPANIDFLLDASVDQLLFQNLDIANASGVLLVKDEAVSMKDVAMKLMGGSLVMNGSYSTVIPSVPKVDFGLKVSDFNIKQTAGMFATVDKLAPVAKYVDGTFSSDLTFKTELNSVMEPVLSSTSGAGKLVTKEVSVSGFNPVEKIADMLKISSLKQLNAPNTNISFKIQGGRLFIDPFDVTLNGMKSTIAGSNGLDQTIDYGINTTIPRTMFGSSANAMLDQMVAKANSQGANVSVGDQIPVDIRLGGTIINPKVTTDLSKKGASMINDLKAKASAELEAKKKEAEEKARAEADRLKKEAEAKVNAEIEKAKLEAEKAKENIKNQAKATIDSAKKSTEKEIKNQLQQLNPFKKK